MLHGAELLAVGTELLLGNTLNTNAWDLSRSLASMGIPVYYHSVVGDNPERLKKAVELARSRTDLLITTGGLGPTCDDLTKQILCQAFGKKLIYHPECAQSIRDYFARSGRIMTENNLQQAYLPEDCTVLENRWGTAPGCMFRDGDNTVLMLPGPPSECLPMFQEEAAPRLFALSEGVIHSRTLRIFGMGESQVESMLRDRMNELKNPTLAPYAKEGEMELRITAKAASRAEAERMIRPVEEEVRNLLGDLIYGADVIGLEEVVLSLLLDRKWTLATAESCTGGLMAERLTRLPGASGALKGGIVSYTNLVKEEILGVPRDLLESKGAVCEETALAMAEGARAKLKSDLAVAITGVAGPDRDDRGNPVGLVYTALSAPDGCYVRELNLSGPSQRRERIRIMAASHGFDMVRRYLTGLPVCPAERKA